MKVWIFLIKFIFMGMLFIVSTQNLYITESDDRIIFYTHFYTWVRELFSHIGEITGFVVDSEWLPNQQTNNTNSTNILFRRSS